MLRVGTIVLNVKDARRASRFWSQVERLISLGATRAAWRYPDAPVSSSWPTPEGNLFCVVNTARE
jgi:hypothetical protein